MNKRMVLYVLGIIMGVEAVFMLPSLIIALCNSETKSAIGFGITIAALTVLCVLCIAKKPKDTTIYAREGFAIVSLSWIVLSLFGAIPYSVSGSINSYIASVFETVSGFTTAGSSVIPVIEQIDKSIVFWRAMTQWMGGMGILVFVLAIAPLAGGRSAYIMRAEVSGPTMGKLVPKIRSTAIILYAIYVFFTLLQIALLLFGGMSLFDAVTHSFATASTGGFSSMNASLAAYDSSYIHVVTTVFMIIGGINYNIFYLILLKKAARAAKSTELRVYLAIIAISTIAITLNIMSMYDNVFIALRDSAFQVSSIMTTTGFVTANYDAWPTFSKAILMLLMLCGGCAGSTSGGFKVVRAAMLAKSCKSEISALIRPRSVSVVKMDGKAISTDLVKSTGTYLVFYVFLHLAAILLVALDGFDFETTVSSVIACFNNIGPGFGVVGAVGNFASMSPLSHIVLSASMLLGRLEIFPLIMLFTPAMWRKA